jgi:hypothetical protein
VAVLPERDNVPGKREGRGSLLQEEEAIHDSKLGVSVYKGVRDL